MVTRNRVTRVLKRKVAINSVSIGGCGGVCAISMFIIGQLRNLKPSLFVFFRSGVSSIRDVSSLLGLAVVNFGVAALFAAVIKHND